MADQFQESRNAIDHSSMCGVPSSEYHTRLRFRPVRIQLVLVRILQLQLLLNRVNPIPSFSNSDPTTNPRQTIAKQNLGNGNGKANT